MTRLPTGKIKCHWCKEVLLESEATTIELENKTGLLSYKGHEKCAKNAQKRYKIEQKLCEIFSIKYCTPTMKKHLNELNDDYSYEVIEEALSLALIPMVNNVDKGWFYSRAIIVNNIPSAVQRVKQKQKQEVADKIQGSKEDDFMSLDIQPQNNISNKDYSSLLD